jgi:fibronectin type 3 domain-containing protein
MLDFLEVRIMMSKRGFVEAVVLFAFFFLVSPAMAATPWLHTDANLIKDPCGNVVVLRGLDTIDIGSVELWRGGVNALIDRVTNKNNTEGNSPGWYPRVIRLAVYPQAETDTSGPWYFETNHDDYYNNLLRPVVDHCKEKDIYAIIDWHFVGDNTYDRVPETNTFWAYMAPKFANDSHVLFELFNEPGNTSGSTDAQDWATCKPNMQTWINIIRDSAPNNLILVAGPSWSQEIGPAADDPLTGTNIVMVAHIYPGHWHSSSQSWYLNHIDHCLTRYPVFMSEWGFRGSLSGNLQGTIADYGQPLSDWREARKISNTAWVTDYSWQPEMFNSSWNLLVGSGEMGGFTKDLLYNFRNADQPVGETIPPEAPTGLAATAGNSTVSLDWDDNLESDLDGYNVYRSTTSGGPYNKLNGSLVSSSDYIDNTASGARTYYYVVTAVDTSSNESDASDEVWATPTDTVPPAVPAGLAATAGNQTVSLNWNNNAESDLAGYNVYRSTTSGSGYVKINGPLLSNSDYIDNSVSNGTTYYYVVTAVDTSSNQSGYPSEVSATPHIITDVNIIGSWVSGTSHTKENGTNRALIFTAHDENNTTVSLTSVTYGGQAMTKVIDRIVSSSSTWAYVVAYVLNEAGVAAATNNNFVTTWSGTPSAVGYASVFLGNVNQTTLIGASDSNGTTSSAVDPIKTNPLAANNGDMVILAATCGNSGSYTLPADYNEGIDQTMNSTATGVTGHKIARAATETPSADHSSSVNRQVIIGFVVKAAAQSDPPPAAPTGLAATGGIGMITLDWNDNAEPDLNGYNVYRSTTSGSGYAKRNSSLLSSSDFNDTNVLNGTTYYYVVTAVDFNNHESGYSNQASAMPAVTAIGTGSALSEWWTGIPGADVNDLTSNVNFPDNPTGRELLTKLEGPVNWDDNYGARIRGYLHPIADGDYTFWIASDANSELWLSTDSNSANAVRIANVPGYTGSREWNKYPEQESAAIPLIGGQKYYIQVLHKEDTGNDNVAVAWQGPGITQQVIDGLYLSPCCLKFADFAGLAAQWDQSGCNIGNDWCNGFDFNRDGLVTIGDLEAFTESWLLGTD